MPSLAPQSFLTSLAGGIAQSSLLSHVQKELLSEQIGALGTVDTYEQTYPAVRSWWFLMADHFLKQVPGLQAQVFGPERLTQPPKRPHPRGRITGGEPIEGYRDYRFREIVIEARCGVRAFRETGFHPGEFESLLPRSSFKTWDGVIHFRLSSPGLPPPRTDRRPLYTHGVPSLSAYLAYFRGGDRWPICVGTGFCEVSEDTPGLVHPLAAFMSDDWFYRHQEFDRSEISTVRRLLEAGLQTFPELDHAKGLDASLRKIRNFLLGCLQLPDEIDHLLEDLLRDLAKEPEWRAGYTKRFYDLCVSVKRVLDEE